MQSLTQPSTHIISTGSAVPDHHIDNYQLKAIIDTSNNWISTRTGISKRHVISSEESVIHLAANASEQAIQNSMIDRHSIDLILLATSTPNDLFGSASQLQALVKAKRAAAFDITAACSGFVIGLAIADQFIRSGTYNTVLVVGADVLSQWVDWSDRTTCILFGDGAGAAVVQSSTRNKQSGILGFELNTRGLECNQLSIKYIPNENYPLGNSRHFNKMGDRNGHYTTLQMNGREVYKFAVSEVPQSILRCLSKASISPKHIDWLILHQANQRILEAVASKLEISYEKVISNIKFYGNTSAASIPIALNEAFANGYICNGDIIVIAGFGAGLTWGSMVIRWDILC
uniref:Beta-ketoacyl-[acyl-carrier-protein] synthase III n=1 Tax=Yamadaella caenomyce TaxID=259029 RepID=A0A1G4NYF2_9FLOR|nr:Beta-ketoacyl-acyl carrier protein synthase III [Yamadaella caenomyce]SCW23723.1 Beta-ketoacyl-acyl carrier protein synthase III [Yamadaella caenomyce]